MSVERSWVLFPRFQKELEPGGPAVFTAEPRHWLVVPDANRILSPSSNLNFDRSLSGELDPKRWKGLLHAVSQGITLSGSYTKPESEFGSGDTAMYRCRTLCHEYQWDWQSVRGFAQEVILERERMHGEFMPLAAILVDQVCRAEGTQRLVMSDETGGLSEPAFVNVSRDPVRAFYLDVMRGLARKTINEYEPRPVTGLTEVSEV